MRVAIVGSSGYISKYLIKRFSELGESVSLIKIGRSNDADHFLDLNKSDDFCFSVLNDVDYIIFTAAISGPDQCAKEFDSCWNVNVTGTCFFIREALKRNCKVLFFSSDAVFGNNPKTVFDEFSETKASTPYGKMKKTVEDAFSDNNNFKCIRFSYVVSAKDKFTSYCLSCIKQSKQAEIFHPFYRSSITISDVVSSVFYLLSNWSEYEAPFLNVAGDELISRVRIADELNRIFNGILDYKISIPSEAFFKNRPQITQMRSLYLKKNRILDDISFSQKFFKELENIKL
ncbi:Nucleoside-diphosphate-sugar epimerase [Succinivibrio dextrinosolvens DSM 3072]|uniref:Nucleoside-diphosphate-sugar epimerase n=1 Tax=Succinivibrio dextrinosolvens DSM 3072 TaxID=1123324 RepID=A0A1T4VC02_9GAMM|nr:NAD-dependent epimerase/dehydratase family protein [Succinivibrio dextrinosolvens]SKA62433.1 Nucleoside-diphosphate-sugar epimerase [Succinivibrio dextrinosolvens DSM 3072]